MPQYKIYQTDYWLHKNHVFVSDLSYVESFKLWLMIVSLQLSHELCENILSSSPFLSCTIWIYDDHWPAAATNIPSWEVLLHVLIETIRAHIFVKIGELHTCCWRLILNIFGIPGIACPSLGWPLLYVAKLKDSASFWQSIFSIGMWNHWHFHSYF